MAVPLPIAFSCLINGGPNPAACKSWYDPPSTPHVSFILRDDKELDLEWEDPMEIRTESLDLIHMSSAQVRMDRVAESLQGGPLPAIFGINGGRF